MNCFETIKKLGILLLMLAIVISFFGCGKDEDEMPMEPTSSNSGVVIVDPVESNSLTPAGVIVWIEIDDNGKHIEKPYSDEDMKRIDFFDQVQDQDVIIAKVKDKPGPDGVGLSGKRVEWILNTRPGAVGDIVETDDPGHQVEAAPQIKVDNKFAFTFTSEGEEKPKQLEGMGPDRMDITLEEGETWIIITSIAKGDTDITAFAPEIPRKKTHKIFAVKHWTDIKLEPPDTELTCINYCDPTPVGANEEIWVSTITSVLNGRALKDKTVEYTIEDNELDAIWVESGTTTFEGVSDDKGKVSATIKATPPPNPFQEIRKNTITIKVFDVIDDVKVLAAKKTITKEWASEFLTIDMICPEGSGSDGAFGACEEMNFDLEIRNDGKCTAEEVEVNLEYPSEAFDLVEPSELPTLAGNIPPGESVSLSVVLKAKAVGTWSINATAKSLKCVDDELDTLCTIDVRLNLILVCNEIVGIVDGRKFAPPTLADPIRLMLNDPVKNSANITLVVINEASCDVEDGYNLEVTLPDIVDYVSGSANLGGSLLDAKTIIWRDTLIEAGKKKEFTFDVEEVLSGQENIISTLSNNMKVDPESCVIPILVQERCKVESEAEGSREIEAGASAVYRVTFENTGAQTAIAVWFQACTITGTGNAKIVNIRYIEKREDNIPLPYELGEMSPTEVATFDITLEAETKGDYGIITSLDYTCDGQ